MCKQNKTHAGLGLLLSLILVIMQVVSLPLAIADDATAVASEGADLPSISDFVTEPVEQPTGETVVTPPPSVDVPLIEPQPDTPGVETPATSAPSADTPMLQPEESMDPSNILGNLWSRFDDTPMDVREVLTAMGIVPPSMITGFAVQFTQEDVLVTEPALDASIAMTFNLFLPEGVPAQLREGDWHSVPMPATVLPVDGQAFDLITTENVIYAHIAFEEGLLNIRFTDGVRGMRLVEDVFTLYATFAADAYAPGEMVELILPDENVPSVIFAMASDGAIEDLPTEEVEALISEILTTDVEADMSLLADVPALMAEDVVAAASEPGLVTDFEVQYLQEGATTGTPTMNSEVTGLLTLTVTDALAGQLTGGSTYTIALPSQLSIANEQPVSLEIDGQPFATGTVGVDKNIVLTFADGADTMIGKSTTLGFTAGFDPAVVTAPSSFSLTLPGEGGAPSIPVILYKDQPSGTWTRPDDGQAMNVKDIFDELNLTPDTIVSGINLIYNETDGSTSSTEATVNASIDFNMSLYIPSAVTQNMREGDTYEMQLPEQIKVKAGGQYQLIGNDGNSYGDVFVNEDGTVKIVFHDNVKNLGNATGAFHFTASFDTTKVTDPGDVVIKIPGDSSSANSTVHINSNVQQAIDKRGAPDKSYNPGKITWIVEFNKPMDTLHNAVLSDALPSGLRLSDVLVQTMDVDVNGNVDESSVTTYTGTANVDRTTGRIEFPGELKRAIRVVYTTDIDPNLTTDGNVNFTNTATLTSDGQDDLTASATVTGRYGKLLDKKNTGYDPVTQEFTWEIHYNYGEQLIAKDDATLTDTLNGAGMEFEQGSIEVRHVSIDQNGRATVGDLLGGGFTLAFDQANKVMTVKFDNDLHEAVIIIYKTKINGIVDNSGVQYSNNVTTNWGGNAHDTGAAKPSVQQNIIKSVYNVDDVNQRVGWSVDVNRSGYLMTNWSMTDHFGTGVHFVDDPALTVQDVTSNQTLVRGTDYTLESTNDQVFTITFQGDYKEGTDHTFKVIYYSRYDIDAPQTVTNSVTGNWVDTNGAPHESDSNASYPRKPIDINSGEKYGTYNAVTKEITWYVLANYHVSQIRPGQLVDPITGDQKYIPGSLKFYVYSDGVSPEQGTQLDPNAVGFVVEEPSDQNNQTLTITFNGNDNLTTAAVWGVFRTSLEGEFIGTSRTYDNNATLKINNEEHHLHGEVSVNHGGEIVDKTGTQESDGYVHWAATINASQSTLQDAVVTDTPSDNQRIDMNSLVIYNTKVEQNGTIAPDSRNPAVLGTDYTATYEQDSAGTWVLTVRFLKTIDRPYIMQYRASIYLTSLNGFVTNNIKIDSSANGEDHQDEDNKQIQVSVVSGGGVIYGKTGAVTIRKVGPNNEVLAGAVFVLQDAGGNRIGPVTVGASGEVKFDKIVQGNYKLYELSAPEGYSVSQTLASGMPVIVDDSTTNGTRIVQAVNDQTQVMLRKVDDNGNALAGAEFRLDVLDNASGTFVPYRAEPYVSGVDGMVVATGLPEGTYRFTETKAPDGYILNTNTVTVILKADEDGVIAAGNGGDFANYRLNIRLQKMNESSEPLDGAVFAVRDENDNAVGSFASGKDGIVNITGIGPGTYTIVETKAPAGYRLVTDPRRVTVPDSADAPLAVLNLGIFTNQRAEGSVILRKIDGDTGNDLEGAVFTLTNRTTGENLGEATSNEFGWVSWSDLQMGDYRVTETKAPDGYILNSAPIDFTVTQETYSSPAPQDLGTHANYRAKLKLLKVGIDSVPLTGATFTVSEKQSGAVVGSFTAGSDGVVNITGISPGTYRIIETVAPAGYVLVTDPREITIPDTVAGELDVIDMGRVVNQRAEGSVILRKVDGAAGTSLAGAVFELTNADTGAKIGEATSNEYGWVEWTGLQVGNYEASEIAAPQGYILNTEKIAFSVTQENLNDTAPQDLGTFDNHRERITLQKVNGSGTTLAGAVFTLYDTQGNTVGEYTSGQDGYVHIAGIGPGTYRLIETRAPVGYIGLTDPRDITIPDAVEGELPPFGIGQVINGRAAGSVILRKVDGDTNTGLHGAVFELTNLDTNEKLGEATSNEFGWLEWRDLYPGRYRITEIKAPEGYIINTIPLEFAVTEDTYGELAPQDLGTFENYQGKIRIQKTDENGAALAGAVFTLYDGAGNLLGDYTSDTAGVIEIYLLKPGEYSLRETKAPLGFTLFEEPVNFEIPTTGAGDFPTIRLGTIANQRRQGVALLHKVDAQTRASLAGAVFQLIRVDTNEVVKVVTTDANGTASVTELDPGDYRFVEITPPTGYLLNATPLPFTITNDAQQAIVEVTAENYQQPGVVTPSPAPTIRPTLPPSGPPQTGDTGNGNGILTALMAISAMTFLGALAVRLRMRKKIS